VSAEGLGHEGVGEEVSDSLIDDFAEVDVVDRGSDSAGRNVFTLDPGELLHESILEGSLSRATQSEKVNFFSKILKLKKVG
jgi:hypothetical protein